MHYFAFYCIYQMNLCILPGSESHVNGLEMNIQRVIKLINSCHEYSMIACHLATKVGDRCSLQNRYGNTKYRNSKSGLGTIVKAVDPMIPKTNNVDCECPNAVRTNQLLA
jgi:hypothetical protein